MLEIFSFVYAYYTCGQCPPQGHCGSTCVSGNKCYYFWSNVGCFKTSCQYSSVDTSKAYCPSSKQVGGVCYYGDASDVCTTHGWDCSYPYSDSSKEDCSGHYTSNSVCYYSDNVCTTHGWDCGYVSDGQEPSCTPYVSSDKYYYDGHRQCTDNGWSSTCNYNSYLLCDENKLCNDVSDYIQITSGDDYKCYYDNGYKWLTSSPDKESSCTNYLNDDCDYYIDGGDNDCKDLYDFNVPEEWAVGEEINVKITKDNVNIPYTAYVKLGSCSGDLLCYFNPNSEEGCSFINPLSEGETAVVHVCVGENDFIYNVNSEECFSNADCEDNTIYSSCSGNGFCENDEVMISWSCVNNKCEANCQYSSSCECYGDSCGVECEINSQKGVCSSSGTGEEICYIGGNCDLDCSPPSVENGERVWQEGHENCNRNSLFRCGDSSVCGDSNLKNCIVGGQSTKITGSISNLEISKLGEDISQDYVISKNSLEISLDVISSVDNFYKLVECGLTDPNGKKIYLDAWVNKGDVKLVYSFDSDSPLGEWSIDYCSLYSDFIANNGWNLDYKVINQKIKVSNCGDGVCEEGETCDLDSSYCGSNPCAKYTCDNGCNLDSTYCYNDNCQAYIPHEEHSTDTYWCENCKDYFQEDKERCNNGLDDDCDGYIDCNDPDCLDDLDNSYECSCAGGTLYGDTCCGDDPNEKAMSRKCDGLVCDTDSNDVACCDSDSDCVYNGHCYEENYLLDIDNDGYVESFCGQDNTWTKITEDNLPSYSEEFANQLLYSLLGVDSTCKNCNSNLYRRCVKDEQGNYKWTNWEAWGIDYQYYTLDPKISWYIRSVPEFSNGCKVYYDSKYTTDNPNDCKPVEDYLTCSSDSDIGNIQHCKGYCKVNDEALEKIERDKIDSSINPILYNGITYSVIVNSSNLKTNDEAGYQVKDVFYNCQPKLSSFSSIKEISNGQNGFWSIVDEIINKNPSSFCGKDYVYCENFSEMISYLDKNTYCSLWCDSPRYDYWNNNCDCNPSISNLENFYQATMYIYEEMRNNNTRVCFNLTDSVVNYLEKQDENCNVEGDEDGNSCSDSSDWKCGGHEYYNGADNNYDGIVDDVRCNNGLDDDCDGLIDLNDPDCHILYECKNPSNDKTYYVDNPSKFASQFSSYEKNCNDGIDNDFDNKVDEEDEDCFVYAALLNEERNEINILDIRNNEIKYSFSFNDYVIDIDSIDYDDDGFDELFVVYYNNLPKEDTGCFDNVKVKLRIYDDDWSYKDYTFKDEEINKFGECKEPDAFVSTYSYYGPERIALINDSGGLYIVSNKITTSAGENTHIADVFPTLNVWKINFENDMIELESHTDLPTCLGLCANYPRYIATKGTEILVSDNCFAGLGNVCWWGNPLLRQIQNYKKLETVNSISPVANPLDIFYGLKEGSSSYESFYFDNVIVYDLNHKEYPLVISINNYKDNYFYNKLFYVLTKDSLIFFTISEIEGTYQNKQLDLSKSYDKLTVGRLIKPTSSNSNVNSLCSRYNNDLDNDGYYNLNGISEITYYNDFTFKNDCNDNPKNGLRIHPDTSEICYNSIDENCDGKITCDNVNKETICSDNIDNDEDGLTDCNDPDCNLICSNNNKNSLNPVILSTYCYNNFNNLWDKELKLIGKEQKSYYELPIGITFYKKGEISYSNEDYFSQFGSTCLGGICDESCSTMFNEDGVCDNSACVKLSSDTCKKSYCGDTTSSYYCTSTLTRDYLESLDIIPCNKLPITHEFCTTSSTTSHNFNILVYNKNTGECDPSSVQAPASCVSLNDGCYLTKVNYNKVSFNLSLTCTHNGCTFNKSTILRYTIPITYDYDYIITAHVNKTIPLDMFEDYEEGKINHYYSKFKYNLHDDYCDFSYGENCKYSEDCIAGYNKYNDDFYMKNGELYQCNPSCFSSNIYGFVKSKKIFDECTASCECVWYDNNDNLVNGVCSNNHCCPPNLPIYNPNTKKCELS